MLIHTGDVFDVLPTLEAGSVQCCVTSPPYWGLRDYGTATWEGGDNACNHVVPATGSTANKGCNDGNATVRGDCPLCGAVRIDSQLGLEETPEEYAESMVRVFREVRRVLADDGTLWLNLGDSYAGSWGAQSRSDGKPMPLIQGGDMLSARQIEAHPCGTHTGSLKNTLGLKPKDLVGIPWRVAFALQADGWWLRSDIIWSKPNPMPESVTDRPTKAHEYIFLLTKSARYYYNHEAIAEKGAAVRPFHEHTRGDGSDALHMGRSSRQATGPSGFGVTGTRNRRTVWTIATQPFPEAHFAVFPETLPSLCIQAGSAIGDTVLDPFAGAGTTGVVAQKLGREFVGIELNPEYAEMAERRIAGTPLSLFAQEVL